MVLQECSQHQEHLVTREISQYIVDISTVQHQMNQVQVVERIQEQNMDPIKVVPEE